MDTILAVISGLASLLAGFNIYQFISIRSLKKKANAEADKAGAEADQEDARADGLNLDNIRQAYQLQGEMLVQSEIQRKEMWETNAKLIKQMSEYDQKFSELERKVRGLEKIMGKEVELREYAERHICLNLECKDRKPTLGTFTSKGDEKKNG